MNIKRRIVLHYRRILRRRRTRQRLFCLAVLIFVVVFTLANRAHRANPSMQDYASAFGIGRGIDPSMKEWYVPVSYRGVVIKNRIKGFPHKVIALTFDDGPSARITPRVLQTLDKYDVRATFFIVGQMAQYHPELLTRVVSQGHAIGNPTYSHAKEPTVKTAELELSKTDEMIRQATGHAPICFRPPYGIADSSYTRVAVERGYCAINWTVCEPAGKYVSAEAIVNRVTKDPQPGDIILMHDGPGHTGSLAALPSIIKRLRAKGFRFVTVPELLQAWDAWQKPHVGAAS